VLDDVPVVLLLVYFYYYYYVVVVIVIVVKVDISVLVMLYAGDIVGYGRRWPELALQCTTRLDRSPRYDNHGIEIAIAMA